MPLRRQQGATLPVTMVLLASLVLGASAAHIALLGEKTARAERDRLIAFQAAEDALMDAERDINAGLGQPVDGDAAGAANEAPPAWQVVDLSGDGGTGYGALTGAAMETGQGTLPFRRPRYLVERLAFQPQGAPAGAPPQHYYRVTAIGFGSRPGTETVLQSTYTRAEGAAVRRHSWREVGDWQALHGSAAGGDPEQQ